MSRALGRALADTSGERAAWRVAVAIAVATLALSLNVVTAVYAQYQGRFDRDAARTAILSGDSDDVTEWVARASYNYAAANERIFVDVTGN